MIIYKIQNKINGKIYIGQTIKPLSQRISQHKSNSKNKSVIGNAIKKYGWDNFDAEIIDTATNIEELNRKEIYWIGYYKSLSPNGYNLELGGRNALHEEETRKKISEANKGRYLAEKSPRARKVYMFSLNGNFIAEYGSVREASRQTNIPYGQISGACRGEHFIARGYRWSYNKNKLPDLPNKSSIILTYNGKSANVKEWAKILNMDYQTLLHRIKAGWEIEDAFNIPVSKFNSHKEWLK